MLPWHEHVQSRHALAGVRLVRMLGAVAGWGGGGGRAAWALPPFAVMAAGVVQHWCGSAHPALALLQFGEGTSAHAAVGQVCGLLSRHDVVARRLPSGVLCRMAMGLHALGSLVLGAPDGALEDGESVVIRVEAGLVQVPVGPWVQHMPLWGNPLLRLEWPVDLQPLAPVGGMRAPDEPGVMGMVRARWLAWGLGKLAGVPGLRVVGDVWRLRQVTLDRRAAAGGQAGGGWRTGGGRVAWEQQRVPGMAADFTQRCLFEGVAVLWALLPPPWRRGAAVAGVAAAVAGGAVGELLRWVGWQVPAARGMQWVSVADMGVADGTAVLMQPCSEARAAMHRRYVAVALLNAVPAEVGEVRGVLAQPAALTAFREGLAALWQVPCDNAHKDVLWRMAVRGVPGAGGCGVSHNRSCGCGWRCPRVAVPGQEGRELRAWAMQLHVFWGCPVALVVRRALEGVLHAATPWRGRLQRHHLWLLQSPAPGVLPGVWSVVCAAAVSAMAQGRSCMWGLMFRERDAALVAFRAAVERAEAALAGQDLRVWRQARLEDYFPVLARGDAAAESEGGSSEDGEEEVGVVPRPALMQRAGRLAVAKLWGVLQDVALTSVKPPRGWAGKVSELHAFLGLQPQVQVAGEVVRYDLRFTVPVGLLQFDWVAG